MAAWSGFIRIPMNMATSLSCTHISLHNANYTKANSLYGNCKTYLAINVLVLLILILTDYSLVAL